MCFLLWYQMWDVEMFSVHSQLKTNSCEGIWPWSNENRLMKGCVMFYWKWSHVDMWFLPAVKHPCVNSEKPTDSETMLLHYYTLQWFTLLCWSSIFYSSFHREKHSKEVLRALWLILVTSTDLWTFAVSCMSLLLILVCCLTGFLVFWWQRLPSPQLRLKRPTKPFSYWPSFSPTSGREAGREVEAFKNLKYSRFKKKNLTIQVGSHIRC